MRSSFKFCALALTCASALTLAACNDDSSFNPEDQVGPNPPLAGAAAILVSADASVENRRLERG